nr:putative reverse transcriptase domain-containing protein [Tanacetum cinerariifolium]
SENFVVYWDASCKGLGAVLMQREKVIAYTSCQLKIHEKNYITHDLELRAIVFAFKMWRHYLYGTKCVVFTDHKSLQHIIDQKELNRRQYEARKEENFGTEDLCGMIKKLERRTDGTLCLNGRSWIPYGAPGTQLDMSTAYHPQTDGQSERTIQTLEDMIRACLIDFRKDEPLAIPLDEIQIDDKLNFIEEPVEIMDREVKWLKQRRIPIVKVNIPNEEKVPTFNEGRMSHPKNF